MITQAQSYSVVRSSISGNLGSSFQSTNSTYKAQYIAGQHLQSLPINLNNHIIFQGFIQPFDDFTNKNIWDFEFKAYPNPVVSILFLDPNRYLSKTMVIKVIDTYGRNVLTSTYYQVYPSELDVSSLSAGIYILQIRIAERIIIKKFTKQTVAY